MDILERCLRQDLLTQTQITRAKEYGRKNGISTLEALLALAFVTPTQLRRAQEKMNQDLSGCRMLYRKRGFLLQENTGIIEE